MNHKQIATPMSVLLFNKLMVNTYAILYNEPEKRCFHIQKRKLHPPPSNNVRAVAMPDTAERVISVRQ